MKTYAMKFIVLLTFLFIFDISNAEIKYGGKDDDTGEDESDCFYCDISPECAVVLVAGGGVGGVGLTYFVAPLLAALGFTATGVASGSLASYLHSVLGVVKAGSLFATLQSIAMSGVGTKITIAASITGASVLASYINDICKKVDEVEKDSFEDMIIQFLLQTFRKGSSTAESTWRSAKEFYANMKDSMLDDETKAKVDSFSESLNSFYSEAKDSVSEQAENYIFTEDNKARVKSTMEKASIFYTETKKQILTEENKMRAKNAWSKMNQLYSDAKEYYSEKTEKNEL